MSNHEKLLARMQSSKGGWAQNDLHALYTGFGFEMREGGSHRFYSHPEFPQLTASVARHNSLANGYAETAIKIIQELHKLQLQKSKQATAELSVKVNPISLPQPKRGKFKRRSKRKKHK